jgi:starch-binding outer membrane protein, SusD/RagB family
MTSTKWKALGLTAALVLLGTAACTDPTVAPKSSVAGTNFFNDPGSYREFLANIYRGLAVGGQNGGDGSTDISGIDGGFSQYLRLYWELEELPTDEAIIAWGDYTLVDLNTQTWTPGNLFTQAMYYRVFVQAAMANEFLRQTTDGVLASRGITTGSALYNQIQTYRAEARFLRALSYSHGLDFFGNIPLVTEDFAIGGATPPPQSTRSTIYNYVVAELLAIKSQLPHAGAADSYGRATDAAADMLLANLYLNAGVYTGTPNYAGALTEASAAIANPAGFTIDPKYQHLTEADNNTSPEIIFTVPEDGQHTQTYGSTTFLAHASCGGSMSAAAQGLDGCWYGIRMRPEVVALFDSTDGRASTFFTTSQTLAIGAIGNFNNGYTNTKWTNKTSTGGTGSNPGFEDTDFPIYRLGEAYLIYAEAQVRGGGGDTTTALLYVNKLRERAYGNATHDVVDSQLTLPFILAERGRELLWEGKRRTDLVRFGEFTGNTYIWSWKGGTQAGASTGAFLNLYPLPATELVANPNLKQNPGY